MVLTLNKSVLYINIPSETRGIVFSRAIVGQPLANVARTTRTSRETDRLSREKKTIPRVSDGCKRNIMYKIDLLKVKNHRFLGHLWWHSKYGFHFLKLYSMLSLSCSRHQEIYFEKCRNYTHNQITFSAWYFNYHCSELTRTVQYLSQGPRVQSWVSTFLL